MNKKIAVRIIVVIILLTTVVVIGSLIFRAKNKQVNSPPPVSKSNSAGTAFKTSESRSAQVLTTREIFDKLPKNQTDRLVRIIFAKMPKGEKGRLVSVQAFVFYNDSSKKTYEMDYIYESQKFLKNTNSAQMRIVLETVPGSAINFGYEGMKKILFVSPEYDKYRSKYPQITNNCSNVLGKRGNFGWEWRTVCRAAIQGKGAVVIFATNLETKKVTVLQSANLPE